MNSKADLILTLVNKIIKVQNLVVKQSSFGGQSLTILQVIVLKNLKNKPNIPMTDLSDSLGLSLSALTQLVERLFKLGYIKRTHGEIDRRLVLIELTPKGKKQINDIMENANHAHQDIFKKLKEDDIQKIISIFDRALKK